MGIFRNLFFAVVCVLLSLDSMAHKLLIPMDAAGQTNHLKAYGVVYAAMRKGITVNWLLNYKGGSFLLEDDGTVSTLCTQSGVTCKEISDETYNHLLKKVNGADFNGAVIKLEKAPRIAVYTPLNKEPWDDAVTMALTYAGIPFDKVYADEVLAGALSRYDWLHLHHEDFTGQYSKFWANFRNAPWYQADKATMEAMAMREGYHKVSQMQLAVAKKIRGFVTAGGNLFAMCTATETIDIALAADGLDICDTPFDGDPADPAANDKLDYANCFALKDFKVITDPYVPFHSDIDFSNLQVPEQYDYFSLRPVDAKKNPLIAMLCQDHVSAIKGFMGQTTAFREDLLKPGVTVLGENVAVKPGAFPYSEYNSKRAKYIHGTLGKGTWTFYGGHDPESYRHIVGSAPTDLNQFPNSAGYRLILDNLLVPAARKSLAQPLISPAEPVAKMIITEKEQGRSASNVKMYSDPANNELIIVIDSKSGAPDRQENRVTITDFNGGEVLNHSYSTQKINVNLKDLPAGMYQVSVNGSSLGKIMKQ